MYTYNLAEQGEYLIGSVQSGRDAGPRPVSAPRSNWKSRLIREPLTHFLLLGIAIFVVAHVIETRSKRYVIDVTPADITRLVNSYAQQYGSEPGPAQLDTLVDNYIREEVYMREGLALGLDKNDEIVRRRVAQKYDFLQQDMATPRVPSASQLEAFYTAHKQQFILPQKRSFDQVYFAIDQRGDEAARALAERALHGLGSGAAVAGDPFPGPQYISHLSAEDVSRLFGGRDFAKQVFSAAQGVWSGPYRSGFGWHLIKVTDNKPAAPRSLEQARDEVIAAWSEADRRQRNAASYLDLIKRYSISRADQPS